MHIAKNALILERREVLDIRAMALLLTRVSATYPLRSLLGSLGHRETKMAETSSIRVGPAHGFWRWMLVFVGPMGAMAATIRVPADQPDIGSAINAAAESDTVLVSPGTYTGAGNKDLNFNGKEITLRGLAGAAETVIDCEGSGRGFVFRSSEGPNAIVEGFTVTNGLATGSNNDKGGAVYLWSQQSSGGAQPTLRDCVFTGCRATSYGGGIYGTNSNPTLERCVISHNVSQASAGGGVYWANGEPTMISCTVWANEATYYGGGVYCYSSSPLLLNCVVTGNSAERSGGLESKWGGTPSLINCIFWGNTPSEITSTDDILASYCNVQGGWQGGGNIDANPLFVAPATGDFRLQAGSPCIDAGDGNRAPELDFEGDARWDDPETSNSGYGPPWADIGIDEYGEPVDDFSVQILYAPGWARRNGKLEWKLAVVNRGDAPVELDRLDLEITGPVSAQLPLWVGSATVPPGGELSTWFSLVVPAGAPLGIYDVSSGTSLEGNPLASASFECEVVE